MIAATPLCLHAVATTPAGLMELVRSYCSIRVGHPVLAKGMAPALHVSRLSQRSLTVENPGLSHWAYWDAGYGLEEFHPIAEFSEFFDHLAGTVLS